MADQGVEQGGFASLELTDTSHIKSSFRNSRCELACFVGNRLCSKLLSQIRKTQQT
jgi:hypothetical protein